MKLKKSEISSIVAFVCNMVLAYIAYAICRIAYLLVNYSTFSEGLGALSWPTVLKGCWMFDTSAILYTNLLFALLMQLPCHFKERPAWQTFAKWVFVVVNSLAIIVNLADAVYFQYTMSSHKVYSNYSIESNISDTTPSKPSASWCSFHLPSLACEVEPPTPFDLLPSVMPTNM